MTNARREDRTRVKGGFYHGTKYRGLLLYLLSLPSRSKAQEEMCSLCEDGSRPPDNGARTVWEGEEWNCRDLSQILGIIGVPAGSEDCFSLQFRAFTDCGCLTFPQEVVCSLCPGGFSDLPMPDIPIPGFPGLTCGDIVFASRDHEDDAILTCDQVQRFSRLCRCPDACSLCRYSDEVPEFPNRIIPFLSTKDNVVTCADHAAQAARIPSDRCDTYHKAPVPVNVPALCGCPMASPANACSLCPNGKQVLDRSLVIPQAGGQTCEALEQYVQFITDRQSCLDIASVAEACCREYDPCPICSDGTNGLGRFKTYEPYSLSCDRVGLASHFGFPLTCATAQERFPFFCRCPGARPDCTICPLGMLPPDPSRFMPLLNMTCGQVNDFLSLRSAAECDDAILSFSVDVAAFCGCIPTEISLGRGRCALCPEGQEVLSQSQMPNQVSITGSISTDSIHCHELADLAPYVVKSDLCRAVQQSTPECCRPSIPDTPASMMAPATRSPAQGVDVDQAPQQVVATLPPGNVTLQPQALVPAAPTIIPTVLVGSPLPTTFTSPQQTSQPATGSNQSTPLATTPPAAPTGNGTLVPAATVPPANVTPAPTPALAPAPTEQSGGIALRKQNTKYWIWTTAGSMLLAWGVLS